MVSIFATLLGLYLVTRAAGWTLRDPYRMRGGRAGYGGGMAATLLVLIVGTVITFVVAAVTGQVW
ncbi:hypothetical protein LO762_10665 [Actinocorallia sp. API 0066]|uniref:hypothetical protein n=1 Tax=Actinocorallia sp. API 0066 TaxID=2896846 RepID=UPI001E2FFDD5|nr:hypothetical protein [Actinocorallia sp. API 0066]MCD0449647.1 hypothetical protein [Actinocorallia sp. API 0066]